MAENTESNARAMACPVCGQLHAMPFAEAGTVVRCVRCHSALQRGVSHSLAKTAAFALAASLLFIPANLLPILTLELSGARSQNTVWDGVRVFYQDGDYFLAVVVFMASIFVPIVKLMGLFFLVVTSQFGLQRWQHFRTSLFQSIEGIGKWAMLDVFVLAIWVSVVKLGTLGSVSPGPGLFPFGCVVVLTLLASASFDPQVIWQRKATG